MVKTRVAQLLVMTNEMSKPYISLFKGKYAANTYMNQYKRQYKQIFGPSTNQPIGNVDTMRKLLPFAISDAFNFSVLYFDSNIGSRASLICGLNMIKDKCGTDFMILGFLKATNEYFNVVRDPNDEILHRSKKGHVKNGQIANNATHNSSLSKKFNTAVLGQRQTSVQYLTNNELYVPHRYQDDQFLDIVYRVINGDKSITVKDTQQTALAHAILSHSMAKKTIYATQIHKKSKDRTMNKESNYTFRLTQNQSDLVKYSNMFCRYLVNGRLNESKDSVICWKCKGEQFETCTSNHQYFICTNCRAFVKLFK